MTWTSNISHLTKCLNVLSVRNIRGREIHADEAFSQWIDKLLCIRREGKTVFLIGNGASSSMASHMAADLGKNARIRSEVLTDPALITAVGNDCGFEEAFAEPLRWRMTAGDMLVAISSSGQSPNILAAVSLAMSMSAYVVTLSAMKANNGLRGYGDLRFYVPAKTYGSAETSHAAVLHYWVDEAIEATRMIPDADEQPTSVSLSVA